MAGALLVALLGLAVALAFFTNDVTLFLVFVGLALLAGVLIVMPIGGADMPVVISLLNSYTGIAVAATGFVLGNYALLIAGTLVGASGAILTQLMCRAMNRSLLNVLFGAFGTGGRHGRGRGRRGAGRAHHQRGGRRGADGLRQERDHRPRLRDGGGPGPDPRSAS